MADKKVMPERNAMPERRWGARRREAAVVQWLGFSAIAALAWLILLTVLVVLYFWGRFNPAWYTWYIKIYMVMTLFFSPIEIFLYWRDKRAAVKEKRRTPESTLLTVAALGGWPGAVIAARLFRHKTKKMTYRLQLGTVMTAHLVAVLVVLYFHLNR